MTIIEEDEISKTIGKTRRESIWSRGRRGPSHHYSKIILRENHLLKSPK
jgi:hypothetical protein